MLYVGIVAAVLSVIPFSAPVAMLMRMTSTTVPIWQIGASLTLLLITGGGMILADGTPLPRANSAERRIALGPADVVGAEGLKGWHWKTPAPTTTYVGTLAERSLPWSPDQVEDQPPDQVKNSPDG